MIALLLVGLLLARGDLLERRCGECHNRIQLPLKPLFFDYLLHYSSERGVKGAMREQLLNPDPERSLVKGRKIYRHQVDPDELEIILQIYWNRYKVIGRIR
ncbi:MAG: hypothetical protein C6I05_02300 [Epsilonproteobacteria bacterium]|nr:hypothetical protein [Campylobacterota bacterium]